MKMQEFLRAGVAVGTVAILASGVAAAHDSTTGMMRSDMHHGRGGHMMHGQAMHGGRQGGMAHGQMMHHGGRRMMHDQMMRQGPRHGMMRGPMGRGMMRGSMFGSRVTPLLNLSVDDVRSYLDWRLKQIGNKRLKVGEVKVDNGTILADISTVDDSLVQRLKVDRHTGAITYEN